jgi:hypothetical protein
VLSHFAGAERTRSRRLFLQKSVAASATVVLAIGAGYFALNSFRADEPAFGGVTCTVVRSNAKQYMAGNLDAQLSERIRIHLEQCADCQRAWREMAASMDRVTRVNSAHKTSDCGCAACQRRAPTIVVENADDIRLAHSNLTPALRLADGSHSPRNRN